MVANKHGLWIFASLWLVAAIATYSVAVPSWMSVATFCWVNAAIAAVTTVLVTAVRAAGPTRSIAHVLYDTEHTGRRDR